MHGGVFDAAGVLINRQPVVALRLVPRCVVGTDRLTGLVVRRDVGVLVPRRAHEGIHGVSLALSVATALRAFDVAESFMELQRAFAGRQELGILGQHHRQVAIRNRHDTARRARNHWNRRAPVALAADQPVAQLVVDCRVATTARLQPVDGGGHSAVAGRAAQLARVDHHAVVVMKEHVAIPRRPLPHLHGGAVLAHELIAGPAAVDDSLIRDDGIQRHRAVVEHHLPAAANDVRPVARLQVRQQQRGERVHLGVALQGYAEETAAVGDLQKAEVDAGSLQGSYERRLVLDRPVPDHTFGALIHPLDDRHDGEAKLQRELEVALVVGGHGHDRARAVGHQHVVGDPDRHVRAVDRVDGVGARKDAGLLLVEGAALDLAHAGRLVDVGIDVGPLAGCGDPVHQRMFWRQHHEGRAPQRVGPGREDDQIACARLFTGKILRRDAECNLGAFGAADPVGLHRFDPFGPVDGLHACQQLVGVLSGTKEPLVEVLLDHRRAAALAVAVVAPNLLARQGGVAMWTKIDRGKSLVGQPQVVQLEEEPLRPLVELGIAGHRLVIPGPHSAHGTHLATHVGDVGQRPLVRVRAHLDRRVLGGQTERVEADGKEDVVPLHATIARRRIAGRHRVPVADMQVARRVRQHRQEVELLTLRILEGLVQPVGFPLLLPLRFDLL